MTLTAFSTLSRGRLHFWTQGKDGTATLHIFVKKAVYDELRSKQYNGRPMGDHANPYRRLADLPDTLQGPIQRSITEIIGLHEFNPSSLKITTIPMQVYKARKMVQHLHDARNIIVGDAAVGLVLEEGVNNGLRCAARHGLALFRGLTINPGSVDRELSESELWVKVRASLRIAHIKNKIGWIEAIETTLAVSKEEFAPEMAREKARDQFGLGADLSAVLDQDYLLKSDAQKLEQAIPHFDYTRQRNLHNQYSSWLLHIDRLYLQLKTEVKLLQGKNIDELNEQQLYRHHSLKLLLDATVKYAQVMASPEATEAMKIAAAQTYEYELQVTKRRGLNDCFMLGRNILKAGEAMVLFERLKLEQTINQFDQAIATLAASENKPDENVVTSLRELAKGIREQATPESGVSLAIVLNSFTQITNQLAQKTLTLEEFQAMLQTMDLQLYGKPPLASKMQVLICAVIGAVVGALCGLAIGLLLAGIGSIPGAILGAVGGTTAAVALSTGALGGTLLGSTVGLFSNSYKAASYAQHREQLKVVMGIERRLEEVKAKIAQSTEPQEVKPVPGP